MNTISLDDIKVYINEILTIDIKEIYFGQDKYPQLDLSYYDPENSNYEFYLKRFEQNALNELLSFPNDQIFKQLDHFNNLAKLFYDYYDTAEIWVENFVPDDVGAINNIDQKLQTVFIVPKHKKGIITIDFILHLQWAFGFKYSSLYNLISQVDNLIKNPESNNQYKTGKSKSNNSKFLSSPNSFKYKKYSSNLSAINETLHFLKDKEFVSQDTKLTDFRNIFNDTKPNKAIQWLSGIESLAYFIKLLHYDFKLIDHIGLHIYKVTASLFVNENNDPFDWNKFSSQKTPSKANLIEMAVDFMK